MGPGTLGWHSSLPCPLPQLWPMPACRCPLERARSEVPRRERDWKEELSTGSASSPRKEVDWAWGVSASQGQGPLGQCEQTCVRWEQAGDAGPGPRRGSAGPRGQGSWSLAVVASENLPVPPEAR